MWSDMGHGWGWGMGFGMIGMVLFWVLIIVGLIALVRWLSGSSSTPAATKTAMDLLSERYARGEIDRREFEEKKRDLGR